MHKKDGNYDLVGYFTLTNKIVSISADYISKSKERKISKFGIHDESSNTYNIAMPLIAQLGKNYNDNLNRRITGSKLLKIACEKVEAIQAELSGKFVYLECEDIPALIAFYSQNEFSRLITPESANNAKPGELIKMIKNL